VRAEEHMRTEMRTRYGLDPDGLAERAQAERDARTPGPQPEGPQDSEPRGSGSAHWPRPLTIHSWLPDWTRRTGLAVAARPVLTFG
ncbi:hypothetical protein, partial [Cellulosimicrobium sp. TH-20]|uniref:hypothetical protein n=1 Tax=Cellulosimicrobium sp. TH-20 TaxID=1980001 RepID=UPI001C92C548